MSPQSVVKAEFLFIVSQFHNDRRQRVRLNGKVIVYVDVVSGVPQGCVLGPLLVILYTLKSSILRFMQSFLDHFRVLK